MNQAEIFFCPETNVIFGQNGQGKTNVLEAISLLSSPRSFRTSNVQDCIENGEESASVFGKIIDGDEERDLGIILRREGRKEIIINDKQQRSFFDTLGKLSSVQFSPEDLELVKSGAIERRKFLDRYLSELSERYFHSLMHYQKALKSKSFLLKSGRAGNQEIETWNEVLAEHATEIIRERAKFLERFSKKCAHIHAAFSPQDGELELAYLQNIPEEEKDLLVFFSKHLQREKLMRRTLVGSQRDDIGISLQGRPAKEQASQGQTRSIVLAMKLAMLEILKEEKGSTPIVLLDDLESELDEQRRALLFAEIFQKKYQVFITGTEIPRALVPGQHGEKVRYFACKNGKLSMDKS